MNRYTNEPIEDLVERAKELECLYRIDEALETGKLPDVMLKLCEIIPCGFRDMKACAAILEFDGVLYALRDVAGICDEIKAEFTVNGEVRGFIKTIYPKGTFPESENAFLKQETRLLNTIANRVSEYIYRQQSHKGGESKRNWEAVVELLQKTDRDMLLFICEKMLALFAGIDTNIVKSIFAEMGWIDYYVQNEINFPTGALPEVDAVCLSRIVFKFAAANLNDSQIYDYISLWIYRGKTYALVKIVNKNESDVKKISNALAQYIKAVKGNEMASEATKRWLTVELINRFLTDNPKLISNAQKNIPTEAFCSLLESYICSPNRIGKIGGKAAGFFIANQIIESNHEKNEELKNIKLPKTWYISSEEFFNVLESNGLDELNEHKYQDILEIRTGYPRIIHMLKNSKLSSYMLNGLDSIIDSCEDRPLIVRSSSLLEDQVNSSFSGKYKSLFLANTGSREERKSRLAEAVLEVYASIFNPDVIQYRKERDLIDFQEMMGVMIQEVVGCRVGPYFFPVFAGVAMSNNEFLWSPRIKREDGLVRMVMGLGTRAVDRVGEDFPILISPGQPKLRVNQTPQEHQKYSPQMIDAINLKNNCFESIPIAALIKKYGDIIPFVDKIASVYKQDFIQEFNKITTDFKNENYIVTFNGILEKTPFISQIQSVLALLKEKFGYPVDVEFAGDGKNLYVLQCRPQSTTAGDSQQVVIPAGIPVHEKVFTANRYVPNAKVTGIKTLVYVDPEEYAGLEKYEDMFDVGVAVGELNRVLPRRSFILMGPGRWGSRGDIKLGVPVTYSDINNAAMLIEIARKHSGYQPELSFGTHFFQDLVEADIKYLPVYPDETGVVFNKRVFTHCLNSLKDVLPEYAGLKNVLKVIQIEENYPGTELIVLMNADLQAAVAYFEKSPS